MKTEMNLRSMTNEIIKLYLNNTILILTLVTQLERRSVLYHHWTGVDCKPR